MKTEFHDFYSGLGFLREGWETADDETGKSAGAFLDVLAGEGDPGELTPFFQAALAALRSEFESLDDPDRLEAVDALAARGDGPDSAGTGGEGRAEILWKALFPEALYLDPDPRRQIDILRSRRLIDILEPCGDPVRQPAREILFTSNVLLSPPIPDSAPTPDVRDAVNGARTAAEEPQLYWYDHPIPVGVSVENDEAVYGLRGLSEALTFEKNRGNAAPDDRLDVLLSVSVTHAGLHRWARPWLRSQLARAEESSLAGLDVYAFTEDDSAAVVELIAPWLPDGVGKSELGRAFGVDGEYGRHYSFLKALPALWSILADPGKKATFKIDLDQVFPQDVLAAETGRSAFEQFTTPLWGSRAQDAEGRILEMGMIAGALVNEKDIAAGLFTPDIPWPSGLPEGEDLLFFKQRPMAVSTRAELMTRYGAGNEPDGVSRALQRIHVTGGTNGIRLDALRRHRPFTPSFVGRAEDQAYILSVLGGNSGGASLRYLHASGLVMRHDKEAFATEAVKAGKAGSYVGDLVRLFVFSAYADLLPGGAESIKSTVDPFTGCFITPMPATLAMLRLALRLSSSEGGSSKERLELLNLAETRLGAWLRDAEAQTQGIRDAYRIERNAWDGYYAALEALEADLDAGDERARDAARAFRSLLDECRISGTGA